MYLVAKISQVKGKNIVGRLGGFEAIISMFFFKTHRSRRNISQYLSLKAMML